MRAHHPQQHQGSAETIFLSSVSTKASCAPDHCCREEMQVRKTRRRRRGGDKKEKRKEKEEVGSGEDCGSKRKGRCDFDSWCCFCFENVT